MWLPELEVFDDKLHELITDHQRHLKLSAGLSIEHAPRVLAEFFWTVLDEDGSVYAVQACNQNSAARGAMIFLGGAITYNKFSYGHLKYKLFPWEQPCSHYCIGTTYTHCHLLIKELDCKGNTSI